MTPEQNIKFIESIRKGDQISFYTNCNSDRKLKKGVVNHNEGLGFFVEENNKKYELRKMIDVQFLTNKNNPQDERRRAIQ